MCGGYLLVFVRLPQMLMHFTFFTCSFQFWKNKALFVDSLAFRNCCWEVNQTEEQWVDGWVLKCSLKLVLQARLFGEKSVYEILQILSGSSLFPIIAAVFNI